MTRMPNPCLLNGRKKSLVSLNQPSHSELVVPVDYRPRLMQVMRFQGIIKLKG
ncbi:Uncharacterized protein DAT39_015477, partial [Clarias magur]